MARGGEKPADSEFREELEVEASAVLSPPPGHPRFPLLDSIRALAAISVLLVHVGLFTGGFGPWYKQVFAHADIGVPVFFLLSGFLLYRPMLAARVLGLPRQKLGTYATNRFVRIMPAYWAVLVITALALGFNGVFTENWWVYFGLLQNLPVYTPNTACASNPFECGVPVAWSLSIELLFYITLPLLALLIARISRVFRRSRWFMADAIVLTLISIVSLYIQAGTPASDLDLWLFFSPLGRGWWFALGMALAVASVWIQQRGKEPQPARFVARHSGLLWMVAGALYAFTAVVVLDPSPTLAFPVGNNTAYLFAVFAFGLTALLILAPAIFGTPGGGVVRRLLRNPVLIWLGLISYGIFLWHIPVLNFLLDHGARDLLPSHQFPVILALTLGLTIVVAALSYYLIERPLMLWVRRRASANPAA
ncbi:MAG: acyltransferase [Solirubrobacterales bacterium]